MRWKEVRNGEPDTDNIVISGVCEYTGKMVEVTSVFGGRVEYKTDLQKTYRFKGFKCSLQGEPGYPKPSCIDVCPLIWKKH